LNPHRGLIYDLIQGLSCLRSASQGQYLNQMLEICLGNNTQT